MTVRSLFRNRHDHLRAGWRIGLYLLAVVALITAAGQLDDLLGTAPDDSKSDHTLLAYRATSKALRLLAVAVQIVMMVVFAVLIWRAQWIRPDEFNHRLWSSVTASPDTSDPETRSTTE